MDNLKKHAIEGLASLWLFIVATQYFGRYYMRIDSGSKIPGTSLDVYTLVYIGMLCFTVAVIGLRVRNAIRRPQNELTNRKTLPAGKRKS